MGSVKFFFDQEASDYSARATRGLWKFFREKEAKSILALLPKVTEKTSLLDLGCGSGYYAEILCKQGIRHITCVDISARMLAQIKDPQIEKICSNIENFRITKKYDIILCAGVLEFTQNPERVFENASTMLKEKGCFILLYPKKNFLGYIYKYYHRAHHISIHLFSEKKLKNLGKTKGFKFYGSGKALPFSAVMKFL